MPPPPPRYCPRCAAELCRRPFEGRPRQVCPGCGHVAYRNPLPVAAALVVGRRGEVLLVQRGRQPYAGSWCLPMGFAELGETIEQAALRELLEEAGVEGEVTELLDASSMVSEMYGDLLVVTFLVRQVGQGRGRAGDDAQAVGWFDPASLPPLPFSSNRRALRAALGPDLARQADKGEKQ